MAKLNPAFPGSPAEDYQWNKIQNPVARDREYIYPGGGKLLVKNVTHVHISKSAEGHGHRLFTLNKEGDNECLYVKPGWIAIAWKGQFEF